MNPAACISNLVSKAGFHCEQPLCGKEASCIVSTRRQHQRQPLNKYPSLNGFGFTQQVRVGCMSLRKASWQQPPPLPRGPPIGLPGGPPTGLQDERSGCRAACHLTTSPACTHQQPVWLSAGFLLCVGVQTVRCRLPSSPAPQAPGPISGTWARQGSTARLISDGVQS